MCLVTVLYDVALSVSWSLNRNACFRHFKEKKNQILGFEEKLWSPPIPRLSVFIWHLVGISAAGYLLFILYIFKIYQSTLEIKGEPILYLQESYTKYSLVQKVAKGLLHIEKTYFITGQLD